MADESRVFPFVDSHRTGSREPLRSFMVPFVFAEVTESGKAELFLPLSIRDKIRAASEPAPEVGKQVARIVSDWVVSGSRLDASQSVLVDQLENRGRDEDD